MVFDVEARLAFATGARRNGILSAAQTRIDGKQRWDVETLEAGDLRPRGGQFGIRLSLRFASRVDADDLVDRIETLAVGANTPVAGSWLTIHDCSHDEDTDSCTNVTRVEW